MHKSNDMIFWNKICGFILFLLLSALFSNAQNATSLKLSYTTFLFKNNLKASNTAIHFTPSISLAEAVDNLRSGYLKSSVSENFSTSCYGFFCREELKIEKATKMPIRFRLGSLEQCNYYEGKKQ